MHLMSSSVKVDTCPKVWTDSKPFYPDKHLYLTRCFERMSKNKFVNMDNSQVGQLLTIWGKLPWYFTTKSTKVLPFFVVLKMN